MSEDSHFRDLVRFYAATYAGKDWRTAILAILGLMQTILARAAEGEDRPLKFSNPKVKRYIVDPPGVLDFFLRVSPFRREHFVGENLNEMVLQLRAGGAEKCKPLAEAIDRLLKEEEEKAPWWDDLSISIKVLIPSGVELQGSFCPSERVRVIKEWVRRRHPSQFDIVLGDSEVTLDADQVFISECDLHKRKLFVKIEGEFGRAMMEEMREIETKNQAECMRERMELFDKKTIEKAKAKEEAKKNRALLIAKFSDDRTRSEERAKRVIKDSKGGTPYAGQAATPKGHDNGKQL